MVCPKEFIIGNQIPEDVTFVKGMQEA